jgi:hypothetical protein
MKTENATGTDTEVLTDVRDWLRYHGDYDIVLSLWGPYCCYSVKATHLVTEIFHDMGTTFSKRLLNALEACKEHAAEQEKK